MSATSEGGHEAALGYRRGPIVAVSALVGASLVLVTVAVAAGSGIRLAAFPLALIVLLAAAHRRLLAWRSLLGLTILVILFIPIKRYTLASSLPFNLEIYRLVVALIFLVWLTSLLIDPRVRLRASGLEIPMFVFVLAIMLSLIANPSRVNEVGPDVMKTLTFFISFLLVLCLFVSTARAARDIDFLVRLLAGGGAVLGLLAIIESRTGYNAFNHLRSILPFLQYESSLGPALERGGRLRVYASAQHPIALGAALAALMPFAIYRAVSFKQRRWWIAALLMLFGVLSTGSRTGILVAVTVLVVYLILRASSVKRLWPALIPVLVAIHVVLPGALGTVKGAFFPPGGIVAEQSDARVGSGRIATLGPVLRKEWLPNPILGEGFATRVPEPDSVLKVPNAPITDDQWLGLLLETGVVGAGALVWIFVRGIRRMGAAARGDHSARGWLLVATTASVAGYGVSMFTYDAFSFIQATFLFFLVLGIGMATLRSSPEEWEALQPAAQRTAWTPRAAALARGK